jgi:hypothetical protein
MAQCSFRIHFRPKELITTHRDVEASEEEHVTPEHTYEMFKTLYSNQRRKEGKLSFLRLSFLRFKVERG